MNKQTIKEALSTRLLILDGAMGTAIQEKELTAEDYGSEDLYGCNEHLVLTRPEIVQSIHEDYLNAGADIVETNTFGGTDFVLDEFGLGSKADEINRKAVQLARAACDNFSTPEKPRYVAGSMGPTTKSLSVTGGITFDEMSHSFYKQAKTLIEAKVDYLLLETALDTLNLKAGYVGIQKAFDELKTTCPIAVSGTIETMGTMLAGQGVEALYTSVEHMDLLYIGLNCATGPEFMRDHIRGLSEIAACPVAVVPNAGMPDPDGTYPESPDQLAEVLSGFVDKGWVNILGGCCGTTRFHIQALADMASGKTPRSLVTTSVSRISGIDPLILNDDDRPYIVGERANVIGSRAFKRLIEEEKFEEACEIARKQVKAGAHILDICLSNPDRDEVSDVKTFLGQVVKMVKVPIMVDSQVPEVVEEAFKLTQGKCILNSVNLEEGEKSFEELLPIVKRYGASVVVGCIESEMAVTAEDKLRVATNSYDLLTQKYGIPEEDIMFDPLVFPCGTGDENYFGSGFQTIDGVRLIKEKYPKVRTTLGISNVSFGLPPAGREVLNSVFLHHCVKSGLDTAIVNSEKLVRYSQITDEELKLCDDLLWYRTENGNDPIGNFVAYFRDRHVQEKPPVDRSNLTLDEKFEINVVEGTKEFLIENLDEALKTMQPLEVINGPLMAAMTIVGKLFNNNELIVAEVLQSAEVMKTAVAHLEQFMDKNEESHRGKLLLATVKGDVHDIGKNLVDIIFSNNGFKVIDLGIKCPPDVIISAVKEHNPDLIGLSGLLVKSAQQMVSAAQDLKSEGIDVPILVGGAALSEMFTNTKIASEYDGPVVYCKDAMNGLDVANTLMDETKSTQFLEKLKQDQVDAQKTSQSGAKKPVRKLLEKIAFDFSNIQAKVPSYEPKILTRGLEDIWDYMNPQMLYGAHLGIKGNIKKNIEEKDEKTLKMVATLDTLKEKIISEKLIEAKAMYQFFKVRGEGDSILILDPETQEEIERFTFPRQAGGYQLCLSDFINHNDIDTVCLFVLTAGNGISDLAKEWMDKGDYVQAHALQSIALECAEGYAEYLHQHIRSEWGIPDDPSLTIDDLFKLKYTGTRVSFGYPACPRLEDQAKLWTLLKPDKNIDVSLSEEFMMFPEASVSALVFHHPNTRYFTINEDELAAFEKQYQHVV